MNRSITETDLATLIPMKGLRHALRTALLPYTRLCKLKDDETLQINAGEQAAWIICGAAQVRRPDGSSRLQQASLTTQLPIAQADAGTIDVTTAASATIIIVDRRRLDTILTWTQLYPDGERPDTWLFPILRSELLTRLPAANVQNLLRAAQARNIAPGETVIKQGDPGADYYLLLSGACEVLRASSSGVPLLIAELQPGDSFGEEALLTGSARNASISASDNGATVLTITKPAFRHLVQQPLLRILSAKDIAPPHEATILDVRSNEEFAQSPHSGARNVPLTDIRDAMSSLSRTRLLAVTCDTGHRASAAAFLLAEAGFDVGVLRPLSAAVEVVDDIVFDFGEDPDRQGVRDNTQVALDDALGEATELEIQAGRVATDSELSERADSAKAELEAIQQRRVSLELKLSDEGSERDRMAAYLRAQRDTLQLQTEHNIASERGRLEKLYALAERRVQKLESTRLKLRMEAERDRANIDTTLAQSEQRLTDEAAEVQRELMAKQTHFENHERQMLEKKLAREAALVGECHLELKRSRQQIEASLAQSVNDVEDAQNRLDAIERERLRAAARQSSTRAEAHRAPRCAAKAQLGTVSTTASAAQLATAKTAEEMLRVKRKQALGGTFHGPDGATLGLDAGHTDLVEQMGRRQQRARDNAQHENQIDHALIDDVRDQLEAQSAAPTPALTNLGDPERPSTHDALARARAHLERLRTQLSQKD